VGTCVYTRGAGGVNETHFGAGAQAVVCYWGVRHRRADESDCRGGQKNEHGQNCFARVAVLPDVYSGCQTRPLELRGRLRRFEIGVIVVNLRQHD
jgi:hypothetical protein